jgi:putative transposase
VTAEIERAVYRCIQQQAQKMRCEVLALNGMPDHVHLVLRAPAVLSLAQITKQIKGMSSTFVRDQLLLSEFFGWRTGYFVHSLCEPTQARVIAYVQNQKQHHAQETVWQSLESSEDDDTEEDDIKAQNS